MVSDVGKCTVILATEGRSVTWERLSGHLGWGDLFLPELSRLLGSGATALNGGDVVPSGPSW